VLVVAALTLASPSDYRWSTTRLDDTVDARTFLARRRKTTYLPSCNVGKPPRDAITDE